MFFKKLFKQAKRGYKLKRSDAPYFQTKLFQKGFQGFPLENILQFLEDLRNKLFEIPKIFEENKLFQYFKDSFSKGKIPILLKKYLPLSGSLTQFQGPGDQICGGVS